MKCKIARHKEGVDEDGAVVATRVTPIGAIRGADHVQVRDVLWRRVGGRWIIVYVSSVSYGTETGPTLLLLAMKTDVPTSFTSSVEETVP
jgi:hypothetical protein